MSSRIFYAGSLLLLSPTVLHAATYTAASCAKTDVMSTINAASDDDTVSIPSGSCTWDGPVSFSKGITIQGAGEGITNIAGAKIGVSVPNGKTWRITGMTISDNGGSGIDVGGDSKAWRIDHITFDHSTGWAANRIIWIQATLGGWAGYLKGVIDHCTFIEPEGLMIHIRGNRTSGGNNEWERASPLGSDDSIYIENCTLTRSTWNASIPVTDCEGGAFVFRYNMVNNSYIEMHHGNVDFRGCRKWEIYENTFNKTDPETFWGLHLRSGIGVVYNNTFAGDYSEDGAFRIDYYRARTPGYPPMDQLCSNASPKMCVLRTYATACTSDSGCGGAVNSCQTIDNNASSDGYPCREQPGWDGNVTRHPVPVLAWNNRLNGSFIGPIIETSSQKYVVNGRDYCSNASDTMPSSCSGLIITYKPFAYPHPLSTGKSTKKPMPPTNIRVE